MCVNLRQPLNILCTYCNPIRSFPPFVYPMRSLATLLLLFGIVAITIGYTKTTATCPPPRVEYRYVPRKYLDEQMDSSSASEVMTDMATTATPYNDSVYDSAARGSMYAAVGATTEMK